VVGGPAAVAAFLFSEIGPLEWTAAFIIASAIAAANGLPISWAGFCDIFGPGNGVRFTWAWTRELARAWLPNLWLLVIQRLDELAERLGPAEI
jgi:hypothetical protein